MAAGYSQVAALVNVLQLTDYAHLNSWDEERKHEIALMLYNSTGYLIALYDDWRKSTV